MTVEPQKVCTLDCLELFDEPYAYITTYIRLHLSVDKRRLRRIESVKMISDITCDLFE